MKGLSFIISESVGALIVVFFLWSVRFVYSLARNKSCSKAYRDLPSFHFKSVCVPGIVTGVCSSVGNVGAVLAVTSLGFSVGYPISHASLIVSGLWGIFLFNEVKGFTNIAGWFLAAAVAFIGMLYLSHEHVREVS